MDAEWLSIICTGLGFTDKDDNGNVQGYVKSDLKRYFQQDDPMKWDAFKQIC